MPIYNKKGQSIVEVLVALSILIIVFTSVVLLVTVSLRQISDSRDRTVAISLAQRGIAEGMKQLQSDCSITGTSSYTYGIDGLQVVVTSDNSAWSIPTSAGSTTAQTISSTRFIKLNAKVTKNGNEIYSVDQIVRRDRD